MAKRRPQSTANDTSSSQAAPGPKTRKASAGRRSLATASDSSLAMASDSSLSTPPEPTEEDIRHRAYLRYLERGRDDGGAFDDWLYAERELKKN